MDYRQSALEVKREPSADELAAFFALQRVDIEIPRSGCGTMQPCG